MNYTIDRDFDELLDRIQENENLVLLWACRLSTGYRVEVMSGCEPIYKTFTDFNVMKNWVDELLKEV